MAEEWSPHSRQLVWVQERTELLRRSPEKYWVKVRTHVAEQGIDLDNVVLARWASGGPHALAGILATRDGRVFDMRVTFHYDREGLPLEPGDGWISKWKEASLEDFWVLENGFPSPHLEASVLARLLLEGERGPGAGEQN
jgi:hypothetical protein